MPPPESEPPKTDDPSKIKKTFFLLLNRSKILPTAILLSIATASTYIFLTELKNSKNMVSDIRALARLESALKKYEKINQNFIPDKETWENELIPHLEADISRKMTFKALDTKRDKGNIWGWAMNSRLCLSYGNPCIKDGSNIKRDNFSGQEILIVPHNNGTFTPKRNGTIEEWKGIPKTQLLPVLTINGTIEVLNVEEIEKRLKIKNLPPSKKEKSREKTNKEDRKSIWHNKPYAILNKNPVETSMIPIKEKPKQLDIKFLSSSSQNTNLTVTVIFYNKFKEEINIDTENPLSAELTKSYNGEKSIFINNASLIKEKSTLGFSPLLGHALGEIEIQERRFQDEFKITPTNQFWDKSTKVALITNKRIETVVASQRGWKPHHIKIKEKEIPEHTAFIKIKIKEENNKTTVLKKLQIIQK